MKPYPNEELERMSKREIIRLYKRTVEQFNDTVPVIHGHWKYDNQYHWYRACCSECGYCRVTDVEADRWNEWKFCPDCGARMDEERKEE